MGRLSATALFAFPFKSGVQPSQIVHFEFGKPVLGFNVIRTEDEEGRGMGEEFVVVDLDVQWQCAMGKEGQTESETAGKKGNDKETETEREKRVKALKLSSGQVRFTFR